MISKNDDSYLFFSDSASHYFVIKTFCVRVDA